MPYYSYRCSQCETAFEELVPLGAASPPPCPECGSAEVKQQLSRVAPPGKAKGIIASARKQAAKEGHFSNYSKSERKAALK
ncbi:zinc ribbon domain-containing protein [Mangrovicoccus sp. HB161399]|uniref:FmdB family zinc ribbon protein n=1 Tax=Mangrovicoccus sp. HB161399 TaxID=2720392 RepID=UPI0015561C9D|nr:zinc ribbon domain-containing protein [Mangrovicoccus sp. HB161399]